jgi:PAS domain S-box-containing protein
MKNGDKLQTQKAKREEIEKQLRESEEKFWNLAQYSPNMIFIYKGGRIVYVNRVCEEIMGYTKEEYVSQDFDFFTIIAPESRDTVLSSIQRHKEGKEVKPYEYSLLTKDGRRLDATIITKLIETEGEQAILGIVTDITDYKKANNAFRKSDERYRMVSKLTSDFAYAFRVGPGGEIECEWVTGALKSITGYSAEELRKRGGWESLIYPDDMHIPMEQLQSLLGGQSEDVEYRIVTKRGEVRWMHDIAYPSWDEKEGQITHLYGAVKDITDRKKAELALRESYDTIGTVLESIDADVYVADMESYEILFMNNTMKESFGKELIGKRCYTVFRNERKPCSHCTNDRLLDTDGNPTGVYIWEGYNPITEKWYMNYDRSIRWVNGRFVRLQVATDITQQKQMENEMQKAEKLESIGILAGGIAHDFNNILTAIIGNISLAKHRIKQGGEVSPLLEEAEKASARATALTTQLLTFSKGGAPVRTMAAIPEIITESANFALRGSKVGINFSFPEDLWPAEVDVGQISHLFHNLIINADQAMPEGGIILVRAENRTIGPRDDLPLKSGRYLKILIHDQGKGIPEKYIPKIFDPYFSTKHRGSGLGLSMSYSIIKKHQGHIAVDSRLGEGTIFHIYLPASKRKALSNGVKKRSLALGRGKILVMDDEEMIRDLAEELLSSLGYDAVVALDGVEAIELFKKAREMGEQFSAVILDLTVPGGMGGEETLKNLLKIDPDIRAIVSSGYSTDPILSKFKRYGFRNVAVKPYKIEDISRVLDEVINGSSQDLR